MSNHYRDNRGETERLLEEVIEEMKKETPDWKKLFEDNGLIDRVTKQREFKNLNSTQLRKFFDEVKGIDYKLQENTQWSNVEADLWKLVPSIKYAAGRGTVPKVFSEFITQVVKEISDARDKKQIFLNFEKIFEAIVAYHKYHWWKVK